MQRGLGQPVAVRLCARQRRFDGAQLGIAIQHVVDGGALAGSGLLRHVRDHPAGRQADAAAVRMQRAAHQREQRGLAGTVRAGHAAFPAGGQRERQVREQRAAAAVQGDVSEAQHGGAVYQCATRRPRILPWTARPLVVQLISGGTSG